MEIMFSSDVCLSVCLSVCTGPVNQASGALNINISKAVKATDLKF